jgi:hypothetical protein
MVLAGNHPALVAGAPLPPAELVPLLLDGIRATEPGAPPSGTGPDADADAAGTAVPAAVEGAD